MSQGRKISELDELKILNSIADAVEMGQQRNLISKITGIKGTSLHDKLEKFEQSGFILRKPGTRPIIYEITHIGKQRLATLRNSGNVADHDFPNFKSDLPIGLIALQKYRIKYEIIEQPALYWTVNQNDKMNGWVQGWSEWKNHTEVINGKSLPNNLYYNVYNDKGFDESRAREEG